MEALREAKQKEIRNLSQDSRLTVLNYTKSDKKSNKQ